VAIFTLTDPLSDMTVQGTWAENSWSAKLLVYYVVGFNFTRPSGAFKTREFFRYLWGRTLDGKEVDKDALIAMLDGSSLNGSYHKVGIGSHRNYGMYALVSTLKTVPLPPSSINSLNIITISNQLIDLISSNEVISWPNDELPINQLESVDLSSPKNGWYFVPLNPPVDTVRRTLSYVNYIADGNTVLTAPAGSGVNVDPTGHHYKDGFILQGEIRRDFAWPRSSWMRLSMTNDPLCPHTIGGYSVTNKAVHTFSGISTFQKINNSSAWIPSELYSYPSSYLYRYYIGDNYADNPGPTNDFILSVPYLWPIIIPQELGSRGFSSPWSNVYKLSLWTRAQKYLNPYARPYADDSDGSGVWHQMA